MLDTATTPGPEVLSATPSEVVLRAQRFSDRSLEPIGCIIYVPRALYLKAISAWLDQKSEISALYNDVDAGVGTIVWTDLTRRPGVAMLAYDAAGFIVDMERE